MPIPVYDVDLRRAEGLLLGLDGLRHSIAEAIAEERERCAKIADAHAGEVVARQIATAIRANH